MSADPSASDLIRRVRAGEQGARDALFDRYHAYLHVLARAQLGRLVRPGFVTATGMRHLGDLPRYVQAIERRLQKMVEDPALDQQRMQQVRAVEHRYERLLDGLPKNRITAETMRLLVALAELAVSRQYVRPELVDEPVLAPLAKPLFGPIRAMRSGEDDGFLR